MKVEIIEGGTALRVSDYQIGRADVTLKELIAEYMNTDPNTIYLMHNGKILKSETCEEDLVTDDCIIVLPRILGGKGGFGSMLRAIGAQIEKTTNRDACRDLSGRRLRDINEEQRLKRWFAKQGERDEEKEELRKQKLERMRKICEGPPLPKIDDKNYNQQRADMAESVFDAVDQGFEASTSAGPSSSSSNKPSTITSASASASSSSSGEESAELPDLTASEEGDSSGQPPKPKANPKELKRKDVRKIKKTMFDEDLDSDVSSSDESEAEELAPKKKAKTN